MAFVAVNPKIVNFGEGRIGLERDRLAIAASQTWKQGEFGIFTPGSTLAVCVSDDIPTHIFREDRDIAEDSTTVEVDRIEVGIQLEMYCASAAVGVANLNVAYDLDVTGTIHTVNLSGTGEAVFMVRDLAAVYEPERNLTADDPGKCIVEIMKII